ncbi:hypothetical protein Hanom_Chr14g01279761 [Helianthus anomalus]
MVYTFGIYFISNIPFSYTRYYYVQQKTHLVMPWRTYFNGIDWGIFLMRHMETYIDEDVKDLAYGFAVEDTNKQGPQIIDLRRKYTTKILLHEINEHKESVTEICYKNGGEVSKSTSYRKTKATREWNKKS